jgi:hypothetical protein
VLHRCRVARLNSSKREAILASFICPRTRYTFKPTNTTVKALQQPDSIVLEDLLRPDP